MSFVKNVQKKDVCDVLRAMQLPPPFPGSATPVGTMIPDVLNATKTSASPVQTLCYSPSGEAAGGCMILHCQLKSFHENYRLFWDLVHKASMHLKKLNHFELSVHLGAIH